MATVRKKDLHKWIMEHRNSGIAVNTKMIILEARKLAANMGVEDFKGTESWCFCFVKRNGLSLRTRTKISQKMPEEYEQKIMAFHQFIINARKQSLFELNQIGNMDEVPLTFDVPSNKSVDVKGTKTVTIKTTGHEKPHYTAVLACCADDTKLPPLLVFKRKTLPKEKLPDGIHVIVQHKGWIDEAGVKVWMEKVWSKWPGGLLQKNAQHFLIHFYGNKTTFRQ